MPIPISIGAVDRGMFPSDFIRNHHPIPEPSVVKTAVDARRLRALAIRELENAAERGDTVHAQEDIIITIRRHENASQEMRTELTADLLAVAEDENFSGEIRLIKMADGRVAYQLERLGAVGDLIRATVTKRIGGQRHQIEVNWRGELDQLLAALPTDAIDKEKEERARQEKAA